MARSKAPTDRSFGFTFVAVFAITGVWQACLGRTGIGAVLLFLCGLTLAITHLRPATLGPFNRAWMKFGALLHSVVSPVVLGAMYFCVVTPIAFLMRVFGRDALKRRLDRNAQTYWIDRTPPGPPPDSLPNQF